MPWDRPTAGIVLADGVNETEVAAAFEVYTVTQSARAVAVADEGWVTTRHGMVLAATPTADAPHLDRRIVLPTTGASTHAFDTALQRVAATSGTTAAASAAKMLEYPDHTTGESWTWSATRAPALALASLLAVIVAAIAASRRPSRRRRASTGVHPSAGAGRRTMTGSRLMSTVIIPSLGHDVDPAPSGPVGRITVAAVLIGLAAAAAAVFGIFPAAAEAAVTGGALVGFALGWVFLGWGTTRFTSRPQRWAYVPAALLGTAGLALLALQPHEEALEDLAWIWAPGFIALAFFIVWKPAAASAGCRPCLFTSSRPPCSSPASGACSKLPPATRAPLQVRCPAASSTSAATACT